MTTCKFKAAFLDTCVCYMHTVFRVRADGSDPRNVLWANPMNRSVYKENNHAKAVHAPA